MEPAFEVNGRRYPVPTNLTLGEMCDAEQFFGVEFGENATAGVRMAAAMVWIAVRRVDASVTVDDIRDLPPDVFESVESDDARPPDEATAVATSSSGSTSGDGSVTTSDDRETIPAISGVPG